MQILNVLAYKVLTTIFTMLKRSCDSSSKHLASVNSVLKLTSLSDSALQEGDNLKLKNQHSCPYKSQTGYIMAIMILPWLMF